MRSPRPASPTRSPRSGRACARVTSWCPRSRWASRSPTRSTTSWSASRPAGGRLRTARRGSRWCGRSRRSRARWRPAARSSPCTPRRQWRSMAETAVRIPLVDLAAQQREVADEIEQGWADVIDRAAFILGDEVEAFEREFAAFTGVEHCVGVASGTDALELALRAVGVAPGDEVLLPANTFI